jgi:hypothetical protein
MIPEWAVTPQMLVMYVLTALGCLVSVFGPDFRRIFQLPPKRWKRGYLITLEENLQRLHILHDNTYGLVLFVSSGIVKAVLYSLYTSIGALIVGSILNWTTFAPITLTGLFIGQMFGRLWLLNNVLQSLSHYEASVEKLKKKILKLKDPILEPPTE